MRVEPEAVYHFKLDGDPVSSVRHGGGHINATYLVETTNGHKYILQRISEAFDIPALMKNIEAVTKHIASRAADPRESLKLVPALNGANYYKDESGSYRVFEYLEGTICLPLPETPEDFYQSAIGFGRFQKMLSDFPAETLSEPIPNFHNTIDRYRIFKETLARDPEGRVKEVEPEIEFALARETEAGTLQRMRESGELPLRVTHNDTKLNNVMLDEKTRKALCVIDLDTVMPGLSVYDFGDSIRFGAATALEDEKDLSKMTIDLELFRIFTKGFMESCDLTEAEIKALPLGAKIMTLECGVRFLTDHIDGDHYFTIHRPGQNLDRARTQFKLVAEMEAHWEEMNRIVEETAKEVRGDEAL